MFTVPVTLFAVAVDRDATSLIYVPGTVAQWAALGVAAPWAIWPCQDTGSPLVESLAGVVNLAAVGSPTYRQAVTGWTRLGAIAGSTVSAFSATNPAAPNITSQSALLLAYVRIATTPGGTRDVVVLGGTGGTRASGTANNTPRTGARSAGNVSTGAADPIGTMVRPWVVAVNRTANTMKAYTDQEIVTPTFDAAMAGRLTSFGNTSGAAASATFLYAAGWQAAAAEMTDATVRTMLQALGWTVAW